MPTLDSLLDSWGTYVCVCYTAYLIQYNTYTPTAVNGGSFYSPLALAQLYHTSACPQEAYSFVDENGTFGMRTEHMKAHVGDDGVLHLVANRNTLKDQIYSLDLERARMLTKVGRFRLRNLV